MMATATLAKEATARIRFEKTAPTIGARVHGVTLNEAPTPETVAVLTQGLHEHGVLFFEFGMPVAEAQSRAFARLFGEVEPYPFSTTQAGSDNPAAGCIDAKYQPLPEYRTNMWHSDGSALEYPPQAAILTSVEPPELGGGTLWASMYAAYEGLSSHYQRLLDGLQVLHSTKRTPFLKQQSQAVHPAIIRDPVTGKKALYVNSVYSERFLDVSEAESDSLMRFVFEHVNSPEFHVGLTWQVGTIAVWEQRVTQHRAINSFVGPRRLRRLTTKGDKPCA